GVNDGIHHAIKRKAKLVALFNNDAVADSRWLAQLVSRMESDEQLGIVTCKFLRSDRTTLDSAGEQYSVWGVPFPKGRDELDDGLYNESFYVFVATGGAILYRVSALKDVGFFDEKYFAYYEDVDLSFRMQLAGWRVFYDPSALAYHALSATSS